MITPRLYDTIELLVDLPEYNLWAGAQGAIVHQYVDNAFEVEFMNDYGETEQLCALQSNQFIVIWQAATESVVSILEQVEQVVGRLPEQPQLEVLDFARSLNGQKRRKLKKAA